jgi:cobalt/nickel transport system permease protein
MSNLEQRIVMTLLALAVAFGITPKAYAMHIMEGYLPASNCIAWGIISAPFVAAGIFKMKRTVKDYRKALLILAMVGAYAFVLSSLKFPSVTGSSSHPTGTGLGAIIFGPTPMAAIGLIVLLFQAILLAHGGLTTLGANTFSMAIAGPILSFFIYKLSLKCKVNNRVGIFLASALGNLFTYCITSVQLGIAHPSIDGGIWTSAVEFLGIFAVTQVPLAIIEGLLTVVVFIGLEVYAKPELTSIGFTKEDR